jgi:hypothetical protein
MNGQIRRVFLEGSIVFLSLFLFCTVLHAEEVEWLRGRFHEKILSMEEKDGALVLRTGARKLKCRDVKTIRFHPLGADRSGGRWRFYLSSRDRIRAKLVGGDADKVEVDSPSLGRVGLKLEKLRGIVLGEPAVARAFERDILPIRNELDRVYLRAGGLAEGVIEEVAAGWVRLNSKSLGAIKIPYKKIASVLLSELGVPEERGKSLQARTYLLDGSIVEGKVLAYENEILKLRTDFARELVVPSKEIRILFFHNGRFVYLSDLKPVEVVESSFLIDHVYPYRKDQNVMGGPLELDGKRYLKGLGVHSRCELVYALGGEYRTFRSVIGIDDSAKEKRDVEPSVVFRVYVDGKPFFKNGISMEGGDRGRFIEVDVTGARKMRLIVDFHDNFEILGRADWADAHLIRK